ncbi:MAG: T6SS effector amidase Tae4 family protein [Bacteroidota bacterium]
MAFKPTRRSRRHRNPHQGEQQNNEAFFQPLQRKEEPSAVQPKLKVGQPGDKYEQEADQVAQQVVDGQSATPAGVQKKPEIQRMPDSRMEEDRAVQEQKEDEVQAQEEEETLQTQEEEEMMQAQEEEDAVQTQEEEPFQKMEEEEPAQAMEEEEAIQSKEEEEKIQPKATTSKGNRTSAGLSQKLKARSGRGKPMSPEVMQQMEAGFGVDFSQVNIHTDAEAESMNKDLHARAFTNGNDIYFNTGQYNPDTNKGKRLLAHELTHTVQQGASTASSKSTNVQRQEVSRPPKKEVLPAFDLLWSAYPVGSADEVKQSIGGKVNYPWIKNTCAIRMSRVLNYSGHPVPFTKGANGKGVTISGADKKWYFFRITDLRSFIERKFGPPDQVLQPPYDLQALANYRGIILFEVDVWDDATGHFTLWNGQAAADKAYFQQAKAVYLWTQ